jgi:hypothetical protein
MQTGRKFFIHFAGLVILLTVFVLLWAKQDISEGIFIAWLGGLAGILGIYTEGNIRAKKYKDDKT